MFKKKPKTIIIFRNFETNEWYIHNNFFGKLSKSLFVLESGMDRLMDILFMCGDSINMKANHTFVDLEQYYYKTLMSFDNIIMFMEMEVDTKEKKTEVSKYQLSLKFNKYLNRELKMKGIFDDKIYQTTVINLYTGIKHLDNENNKYFDNLGVGNNVAISWFVRMLFGFRLPKKINIGNIKTNVYTK